MTSGEFLTFEQESGRLVPGKEYKAMQTLLSSIESYRHSFDVLHDTERMGHHEEIASALRAGDTFAYVQEHDLMFLFRSHDEMLDILRLSMALLRHIAQPTEDLRMPELSPITPLTEEVAEIEAEEATHEDVEHWVSDRFLWSWLTDENVATREDMQAAIRRFPFVKRIVEAGAERVACKMAQHKHEFEQIIRTSGVDAAVAWLSSLKEDS